MDDMEKYPLRRPPETKEEVVTSMCYTWRHDYGAPVSEDFPGLGMTDEERQFLWNQMAQLYDHHVAPYRKQKPYVKHKE